MKSKELLTELDLVISDIKDDNTVKAIKRLEHLKKVALYKTFRNNEFLDYYKQLKPQPQLYEQITTWKNSNECTKEKIKYKISDLEILLKNPSRRFAFMEVTRDFAWMVVSEDEHYDDAPATKYRYFGVKI